MALPTFTQFSTLTTAGTPALDNNFLVLAAMSATPCAVVGTNSLTMTPLTNTPTVSQYNQLQAFSGIAAATNTGAVTATVGTLGSLPVYRDTSTGPVALTGSEIVVNNAFMLLYDAALNAGGGGFHLVTGPAVKQSGDTLSNTTLTGTTTVQGTAQMSGAAVNEAYVASVASASTVDIAAQNGNYIQITGTMTITSFGNSLGSVAGAERTVVFSGSLTLTYGSNLLLPTGASIQTAAGDVAKFRYEGSSVWRCVSYTRADGTPINQIYTASVASAATVDLGAQQGDYIQITGTTTITSFGTTARPGMQKTVVFAGALTLTYNSSSLILPSANNITTAAGDTAVMRCESSGNWRCISYNKANGQAVVYASTALILISTQTVTAGTTVQWTGLGTTYNNYMILWEFEGAYSVAEIQFGEGATPTWETSNYSFAGTATYNGTTTIINANAQSYGAVDTRNSSANKNSSGQIIITNLPCNSGNFTEYMSLASGYDNTTNNCTGQSSISGVYYGDTTAKTAIRLVTTSNVTGIASLYAIGN